MLPGWLVLIGTILFFVSLIGAFLFILAIAAGLIKPAQENSAAERRSADSASISRLDSQIPDSATSNPSNADSLPSTSTDNMEALRESMHKFLASNSRVWSTWSTYGVFTPLGLTAIPTLEMRWADLFEQSNRELLHYLSRVFLKKFSKELTGVQIHVVSQFGLDFFYPVKNDLSQMGTSVYIYNQFEPTPPTEENKIVLFDISYSSGRTARLALNHLVKLKYTPTSVLFVFFNDLVPPESQYKVWREADADLKYLYSYSDIISLWKEQRELADAILAVRDAAYGKVSWREPQVQSSLETLHRFTSEPALK